MKVLPFLLLLSLPLFADQTPKKLGVSDVSASSYLKSGDGALDANYHPNYAFDGDPKTAWTEGVEGLGEGETLEFRLSPLFEPEIFHFRLWNGYQKSKKLLKQNAAPKEIEFTFYDEKDDELFSHKATFEKKMGPQDFFIVVYNNIRKRLKKKKKKNTGIEKI